jgi:hypothetical protein
MKPPNGRRLEVTAPSSTTKQRQGSRGRCPQKFSLVWMLNVFCSLPGCRRASTISSSGTSGRPLAREQRRLAPIMAVDVVGYSRLMGRDPRRPLGAPNCAPAAIRFSLAGDAYCHMDRSYFPPANCIIGQHRALAIGGNVIARQRMRAAMHFTRVEDSRWTTRTTRMSKWPRTKRGFSFSWERAAYGAATVTVSCWIFATPPSRMTSAV